MARRSSYAHKVPLTAAQIAEREAETAKRNEEHAAFVRENAAVIEEKAAKLSQMYTYVIDRVDGCYIPTNKERFYVNASAFFSGFAVEVRDSESDVTFECKPEIVQGNLVFQVKSQFTFASSPGMTIAELTVYLDCLNRQRAVARVVEDYLREHVQPFMAEMNESCHHKVMTEIMSRAAIDGQNYARSVTSTMRGE